MAEPPRPVLLDEALGEVYARALVAIARADGELVLDEILRLRGLVARRLGRPVDDAVLFGDDVTVEELAAAASRASGDPFRTAGPTAREVGRLLIADGLAMALADGDVAAEEVAMVERLAGALGCSDDDLAEIRGRLPRWLDPDGGAG